MDVLDVGASELATPQAAVGTSAGGQQLRALRSGFEAKIKEVEFLSTQLELSRDREEELTHALHGGTAAASSSSAGRAPGTTSDAPNTRAPRTTTSTTTLCRSRKSLTSKETSLAEGHRLQQLWDAVEQRFMEMEGDLLEVYGAITDAEDLLLIDKEKFELVQLGRRRTASKVYAYGEGYEPSGVGDESGGGNRGGKAAPAPQYFPPDGIDYRHYAMGDVGDGTTLMASGGSSSSSSTAAGGFHSKSAPGAPPSKKNKNPTNVEWLVGKLLAGGASGSTRTSSADHQSASKLPLSLAQKVRLLLRHYQMSYEFSIDEMERKAQDEKAALESKLRDLEKAAQLLRVENERVQGSLQRYEQQREKERLLSDKLQQLEHAETRLATLERNRAQREEQRVLDEKQVAAMKLELRQKLDHAETLIRQYEGKSLAQQENAPGAVREDARELPPAPGGPSSRSRAGSQDFAASQAKRPESRERVPPATSGARDAPVTGGSGADKEKIGKLERHLREHKEAHAKLLNKHDSVLSEFAEHAELSERQLTEKDEVIAMLRKEADKLELDLQTLQRDHVSVVAHMSSSAAVATQKANEQPDVDSAFHRVAHEEKARLQNHIDSEEQRLREESLIKNAEERLSKMHDEHISQIEALSQRRSRALDQVIRKLLGDSIRRSRGMNIARPAGSGSSSSSGGEPSDPGAWVRRFLRPVVGGGRGGNRSARNYPEGEQTDPALVTASRESSSSTLSQHHGQMIEDEVERILAAGGVSDRDQNFGVEDVVVPTKTTDTKDDMGDEDESAERVLDTFLSNYGASATSSVVLEDHKKKPPATNITAPSFASSASLADVQRSAGEADHDGANSGLVKMYAQQEQGMQQMQRHKGAHVRSTAKQNGTSGEQEVDYPEDGKNYLNLHEDDAEAPPRMSEQSYDSLIAPLPTLEEVTGPLLQGTDSDIPSDVTALVFRLQAAFTAAEEVLAAEWRLKVEKQAVEHSKAVNALELEAGRQKLRFETAMEKQRAQLEADKREAAEEARAEGRAALEQESRTRLEAANARWAEETESVKAGWESERAGLQQEKEQLAAENGQLRAERVNLAEAQGKVAEAEKRALLEKIARIEVECEKHFVNWCEEADKWKAKVAALEAELVEQRGEAEKLRKCAAEQRGTLQETLTAEFESRCTALEADKASLRGETRVLEEEKLILQQQIMDLEENVAATVEAMNSGASQLMDTSGRLHEEEAKRRELAIEHSALQTELKELQRSAEKKSRVLRKNGAVGWEISAIFGGIVAGIMEKLDVDEESGFLKVKMQQDGDELDEAPAVSEEPGGGHLAAAPGHAVFAFYNDAAADAAGGPNGDDNFLPRARAETEEECASRNPRSPTSHASRKSQLSSTKAQLRATALAKKLREVQERLKMSDDYQYLEEDLSHDFDLQLLKESASLLPWELNLSKVRSKILELTEAEKVVTDAEDRFAAVQRKNDVALRMIDELLQLGASTAAMSDAAARGESKDIIESDETERETRISNIKDEHQLVVLPSLLQQTLLKRDEYLTRMFDRVKNEVHERADLSREATKLEIRLREMAEENEALKQKADHAEQGREDATKKFEALVEGYDGLKLALVKQKEQFVLDLKEASLMNEGATALTTELRVEDNAKEAEEEHLLPQDERSGSTRSANKSKTGNIEELYPSLFLSPRRSSSDQDNNLDGPFVPDRLRTLPATSVAHTDFDAVHFLETHVGELGALWRSLHEVQATERGSWMAKLHAQAGQLVRFEEQIGEKDEQIAGLEEANRELQVRVKSEKLRVDTRIAEVGKESEQSKLAAIEREQALKQSLRERGTEILELQKKLDGSRSEAAGILQAKNSAELVFAEAEAVLKQEVKRQLHELASCRQEILAWREAKASLDEDLREQKESHEKDVQKAQLTHTKTVEDLNALWRSDKDLFDARVEDFENEREQALAGFDTKEQQLNAEVATWRELYERERQIATLSVTENKQILDELTNKLQGTETELGAVTTERNALKAELARLTEDNEILSAKFAELLAVAGTIEEANKSLSLGLAKTEEDHAVLVDDYSVLLEVAGGAGGSRSGSLTRRTEAGSVRGSLAFRGSRSPRSETRSVGPPMRFGGAAAALTLAGGATSPRTGGGASPWTAGTSRAVRRTSKSVPASPQHKTQKDHHQGSGRGGSSSAKSQDEGTGAISSFLRHSADAAEPEPYLYRIGESSKAIAAGSTSPSSASGAWRKIRGDVVATGSRENTSSPPLGSTSPRLPRGPPSASDELRERSATADISTLNILDRVEKYLAEKEAEGEQNDNDGRASACALQSLPDQELLSSSIQSARAMLGRTTAPAPPLQLHSHLSRASRHSSLAPTTSRGSPRSAPARSAGSSKVVMFSKDVSVASPRVLGATRSPSPTSRVASPKTNNRGSLATVSKNTNTSLVTNPDDRSFSSSSPVRCSRLGKTDGAAAASSPASPSRGSREILEKLTQLENLFHEKATRSMEAAETGDTTGLDESRLVDTEKNERSILAASGHENAGSRSAAEAQARPISLPLPTTGSSDGQQLVPGADDSIKERSVIYFNEAHSPRSRDSQRLRLGPEATFLGQAQLHQLKADNEALWEKMQKSLTASSGGAISGSSGSKGAQTLRKERPLLVPHGWNRVEDRSPMSAVRRAPKLPAKANPPLDPVASARYAELDSVARIQRENIMLLKQKIDAMAAAPLPR